MSELLNTKTVEQIKQELGPVKASQILRMTKLEQCYGNLTDGKNKFCARGAILKHFGWDGDVCKDMHDWWTFEAQLIDHSILTDIVKWNDSQHLSFEQIADKLEELGY